MRIANNYYFNNSNRNYIQQNKKQNPNFNSIKIVKADFTDFFLFILNNPEFYEKNIIFRSKSPFHAEFDRLLKLTSINEGQTMQWMEKNALIHNCLYPDYFKEKEMYIFTGKDIFKYKLFMLKNLLSSIRTRTLAKTYLRANNYPEHLLELRAIKTDAEKRLPAFTKFIKRNNPEKLSYNDFIDKFNKGKI